MRTRGIDSGDIHHHGSGSGCGKSSSTPPRPISMMHRVQRAGSPTSPSGGSIAPSVSRAIPHPHSPAMPSSRGPSRRGQGPSGSPHTLSASHTAAELKVQPPLRRVDAKTKRSEQDVAGSEAHSSIPASSSSGAPAPTSPHPREGPPARMEGKILSTAGGEGLASTSTQSESTSAPVAGGASASKPREVLPRGLALTSSGGTSGLAQSVRSRAANGQGRSSRGDEDGRGGEWETKSETKTPDGPGEARELVFSQSGGASKGASVDEPTASSVASAGTVTGR